MSCHTNMMPQQVSELKKFVEALQMKPEILHAAELRFFKEYIESLGGKIPDIEAQESAPKEAKPESCPFSDTKAKEEKPDKMEDEEEDIPDFVPEPIPEDLVGKEGVIEPESEPMPEVFEYNGEEIEETALEKSNELRSEAMSQMSEGNFAEAVEIFTKAIKVNPESSVLYAKRAQTLLKQKRVKAVIADCDEAIKRNPDSCLAHKLRGRAYRLLGEWLNAAHDLRKACKLDCDEQAMEWLSEVQANATKIEEYERGQQRAKAEHELSQRQQRVRRARKAQEEARKKADKESANSPDFDEMPEGMGGMGGLFSDPELLSCLQDPEVSTAFADIMSNPMNIMKYKDNPKIMKLISKMKGMGGMGGMGGGMPGGMGGMGGFPGGMGGFPGGMGGPPPSGGAAPPPPSSTSDDLD